MKKLILAFFLAAFGLSSFAQHQTPVDYKTIEKNVNDPSSELYYPKLLERYNNGDSTFTREEKRNLYYGYVFQPTYSAMDTSRYNQRLMTTLSKGSLTPADYGNVLADADALLKEDPFNIRAMNAKLLVYAQQDNVPGYKKVIQQRKNMLEAVLSSGDGIEKKTAFYVIKVAHEYDLLGLFGYKFGGSDKVIDHYNYLKLAENRFGIDGLYFDISPVLRYMSEHSR
ncbi:MAG: DUF4919 domain-containing protein [Petrimonas sp.]|nr:DUF4919 domain-containing protein [Petrimonas sp.]